jgi:hypothetical protein
MNLFIFLNSKRWGLSPLPHQFINTVTALDEEHTPLPNFREEDGGEAHELALAQIILVIAAKVLKGLKLIAEMVKRDGSMVAANLNGVFSAALAGKLANELGGDGGEGGGRSDAVDHF